MTRRPPSAVASVRALLTCIAVALVLAGCAQPLTPQQISERFWRAVVTQHPDKIKRYVRDEDRELLGAETELLPVESFTLGRAVIEGDAEGARASVETTLVLSGDSPVSFQVDTQLVRQQGRWQVDYQRTVSAITLQSNLARVIDQIGDVGEALQEGIEKSVEEMSTVLPALERQLERIESEIEQQMPELRRRLEEFSREFERALEAPPGEAPPADVGDDATIAL